MFSFSLEGLTGGAGIGNKPSSSLEGNSSNTRELRHPFSGQERGDSLVSLSEEDLESGQREHRMFNQQTCHRSKQQGFNYCTSAVSSPLTKSVSLMTISHPGLDGEYATFFIEYIQNIFPFIYFFCFKTL